MSVQPGRCSGAKGPCVGEVAVWETWGTADADHQEGSAIVRDYYRTAKL